MAIIWSEVELQDYVQEGYDALVMATGCLWATQVFPDYPYAFNYTQPFEFDYFVGGDRVAGIAQFTSEFERDYTLNNSEGPANHSFHWEYDGGYVSITEISALVDMPEDSYEIERATWNTQRIEAFRSRDVEMDDMRYELNTGYVEAYIQDKDGLRILRKWRKPAAAYVGWTYESTSDDWGILRDVNLVTNSAHVQNSYGELRRVDGETVIGGPWGIIRNIYKDNSNLRMEYRRRGLPLSLEQDFEIPGRQQVYVRHYAMARSFERDGDGQDLDLAAHYQSRYEAGVARMLKRKTAMHYQQKYVMGGNVGMNRNRKPLVRLPYQYGERVR